VPYEAAPQGAAFFATPSSDGYTSEDAMNTFRRQSSAKSVMFVVNFDDDRTAYLWIDTPSKANDDRVVSSIARAQQQQGTLPEGNITSIKRVR
jgi:hypothetical protein